MASLLFKAALRAAILSGTMVAAPFAASAACFSFGEVVTITGRYEAAGETEFRNRLLLDVPICVDADVLSPAVAETDMIQVLCPDAGGVSGSPLTVTGRLRGAHTGNGQIPILLACGT